MFLAAADDFLDSTAGVPCELLGLPPPATALAEGRRSPSAQPAEPMGDRTSRPGDRAETHRFEADFALARRLAGGDPQAVRSLMERNQGRLLRTAAKILKDHAEAEDAVQSGLAKAVAAIDQYSGRSTLSTWLTRIVMNEALARARKAKFRAERLTDNRLLAVHEYREALAGFCRHETPEAAFVRGEIRLALDKAIKGLPGVFRDVFLLRAVDGLSVAETAERLGLNVATVKTRHLRARRRLREALSPQIGPAFTALFSFPTTTFDEAII